MDYSREIKKSIDYIEANLCKEIKLSNLAQQSYLSRFYFHRIFRNLVGETIMVYVRKRRLTEAALELIRTDNKIIDIALKYQFGSQESFARAFKKMYGMAPREYRHSKRSIILSDRANTLKTGCKKSSSNENSMLMAA